MSSLHNWEGGWVGRVGRGVGPLAGMRQRIFRGTAICVEELHIKIVRL